MKSLLRITCLLLLYSLLLPLCAGEKEQIRMTYSVFFPATHVHSKLAVEWAQEIYRRSDGRVKIDVYPGGVLTGAAENYECVVKGVSDIGMSCFSYSRGMFPMLECLDLPLGYRSGYQATLIANAYYRRFFPEETDETAVMYLHAHGPGVLATRRPVTEISQLQGCSIRGTGISAMIIRAFKANPIGMGQPDTYEALRKGVVDATLCPVETLKGWRQGEVIEHVVKIPSAGYTTAMFVVMNRRRWQSLPADIRRIFRKVNEEWILKHGRAWDEADEAGEAFVNSLKKDIAAFSPSEDDKARALLAPMLKRWGTDLDDRHYHGTAAMAFLQEAVASTELQLRERLREMPPEKKKGAGGNLLQSLADAVQQNVRQRLSMAGHLLMIGGIVVALALIGLFTHHGGAFQRACWNGYQRCVSAIALFLLWVAEGALLMMIAVTIIDIIGRRFGMPLHGAIDAVQILACISTATALPYVTAVKGHIAVEYFFQRFSARARVFWDSLSRTLTLLFFTYMTIVCVQQGIRLYAKHAVALSLGIPLFWIFHVMAFAFFLVILVVLFNLTHPGKPMMNP